MNTLVSMTKFLLFLNPVIPTFVNFTVSDPTFTSKQPVPSPLLLFTLSLIIAIHSTLIFQILNLIALNLTKTLLPVPLLKPLSFLVLSPFLNPYTGKKLMNV